jgi:pentatricopeptide repeat protein
VPRRELSRNRNYSLNSDINFLKKKSNGTYLAEQRLETAIQQMLESTNTIDGEVALNDQLPDIVSFNAIISAHARNGYKDRKAADLAEKLLRRMDDLSKEYPHLTPDIFTLNSVMEAHSKRFNAEERSDAVTSLYTELKERGLSANTYTLNLLLASVSCTSKLWNFLETWALAFLQTDKSGDASGAGTTENTAPKPDRQTYNTLFRVYGKDGAFSSARSLMNRIVERHQHLTVKEENGIFELSKVWYHCIFNALATTTELDRTKKEGEAKNVLREMEERSENRSSRNLAPDTETHNHVLNVYALAGDTVAALSLLENMEARGTAYQPDCISYTTAIKAFATAQQNATSDSSNKNILLDLAEQATNVFDNMPVHASPNSFTCKFLVLMNNFGLVSFAGRTLTKCFCVDLFQITL